MGYRALGLGLALLMMINVTYAEEKFILKSDQAPTGSNFKDKQGIWSIPLDKPYDQLTIAQQNIVRSSYETFPIWDEPPFPKKGIGGILGNINQISQKALLRGDLFVVAHVDAQGDVKEVKFYQTPDPTIVQAVALILYKEKFKPAICSGVPCEMDFPLSLKFDYSFR